MANAKYQTLTEFILKPFNKQESMDRDVKLRTMYLRMQEKIYVKATMIVESAYYVHVKIPSESKTNQNGYDVVIRFFTDNPSVANEDHLMNYYIQFYSNSPSFMYQYAYLYNKHGYLIPMFYNKTDTDYINKPPEKRNPNMRMTYDKSIYAACNFLASKQYASLTKRGHFVAKKVSQRKFLGGIPDFQAIKMDVALATEEKKLARELKKNSTKEEEKDTGKKQPTKKLTPTSAIQKIVAKRKTIANTTTASKRSTRVIRPSRSTRRR